MLIPQYFPWSVDHSFTGCNAFIHLILSKYCLLIFYLIFICIYTYIYIYLMFFLFIGLFCSQLICVHQLTTKFHVRHLVTYSVLFYKRQILTPMCRVLVPALYNTISTISRYCLFQKCVEFCHMYTKTCVAAYINCLITYAGYMCPRSLNCFICSVTLSSLFSVITFESVCLLSLNVMTLF